MANREITGVSQELEANRSWDSRLAPIEQIDSAMNGNSSIVESAFRGYKNIIDKLKEHIVT